MLKSPTDVRVQIVPCRERWRGRCRDVVQQGPCNRGGAVVAALYTYPPDWRGEMLRRCFWFVRAGLMERHSTARVDRPHGGFYVDDIGDWRGGGGTGARRAESHEAFSALGDQRRV